MSERQAILECLKTRGQLSASSVADLTGLTSMGARGHLERLELSTLVRSTEIKEGRGRPKKLWLLTEHGHEQFGQRYDHLSVELIKQVKKVFGEEGLTKLIESREQTALTKYTTVVENSETVEQSLTNLAEERSREGYMAEIIATDKNQWELIEHHCPICAAAESCQGFCQSELTIFQKSLGSNFTVSRSEHLLSDGERCRYLITQNI